MCKCTRGEQEEHRYRTITRSALHFLTVWIVIFYRDKLQHGVQDKFPCWVNKVLHHLMSVWCPVWKYYYFEVDCVLSSTVCLVVVLTIKLTMFQSMCPVWSDRGCIFWNKVSQCRLVYICDPTAGSKLFTVVAVSFGLLCVLQVSLNISLRLICRLTTPTYDKNEHIYCIYRWAKSWHQYTLAVYGFLNQKGKIAVCYVYYAIKCTAWRFRIRFISNYSQWSEMREQIQISNYNISNERNVLVIIY